jgi:hypothetical protein
MVGKYSGIARNARVTEEFLEGVNQFIRTGVRDGRVIALARDWDGGLGSQTCSTNIRLLVPESVNRPPQILDAIRPPVRLSPLELRPQ